jgi:radical SAM superfamily enzyme YgiQ (UPF0313 family)
MPLDLLFFHGYRLADDPREQEIMRPFPPLGLQYLVAFLRREGFPAVDLWDATFAPSLGGFHERAREEQARVVGLYGHTLTRPVTLPMAQRSRAEGRRVIAGGPDPVQYVDEYLDGGVEVIVVGEGERTLLELMRHLRDRNWSWDWSALRSVQGIIFRDEAGEVVRTPERELIQPLDQLPWPARDHRDLDRYLRAWRARHGETALSMTTSRGCPFSCTWCSKQVYGDSFRRRSVEDVVEEMLFLRKEYAPDQLWFVDDMFTINKRWVHAFCDEVVRRGAQIPFYLVGRPETLDPELLRHLREAGCFRIYCSAESGAQHVLDAMNKHTTVEEILAAGVMLRQAGIEMGVFVMLGYPGEELEDVKATLRMINTLDPAVALLSVAHPMKGTAFYDSVADHLTRPPGWEEKHGGRLAFRMRFPMRFYEAAQRHIWNDSAVRRKLAKRELDAELVRLLAKWPANKLAFEGWGRWPGRWPEASVGSNTAKKPKFRKERRATDS